MRGNASKNIRNFNINVGAGLKPARFAFCPLPSPWTAEGALNDTFPSALPPERGEVPEGRM
ncbi:MAG: hypothetical protein ABIE74_11260, partial [Pseudomonadota bacterium]